MRTHNIKVIEFIFYNSFDSNNSPIPLLGLFKVDDIISITQINEYSCVLTMITGQTYNLLGTLRVLHNRYLYALEKDINDYYDPIIRPSATIHHNPYLLEGDGIFMDILQLINFFKIVKPELLNDNIIKEKINIMKN